MAQAQAPTSRTVFISGVQTTLPPNGTQDIVVQLWDSVQGGNVLFSETQFAISDDSNSTLAFVFGSQTAGGLDPTLFPSGSSRYVDVTDTTGASVLAGGRLLMTASPFALSPGPQGPQGPVGPQGPPGPVASVSAADRSIIVLGSPSNPTIAVASNGVTDAHVASGALSPTKIVGTAATLGSNTFTGNQIVNAQLGIGTPPQFGLHLQGTQNVEARIQNTALLGPATLSFSSPTLIGPRVYAVGSTGGLFSIADRTASQNRMVINTYGTVGIGTNLTFPQGKLDVLNDGSESLVAVAGTTNLANGVGVMGWSDQGTGVQGRSSNGWAGDFQGSVRVNGLTQIYGYLNSYAGLSVYNNSLVANSGAVVYNGLSVTGSLSANSGAYVYNGLNVNGSLYANSGAYVYNGLGVYNGLTVNSNGASIYGNSFVNGNLAIYGNLTKQSGSFKIDHPLAPGDKYLSHSFVESPDMMNIYNGTVVLDERGEATIALPAWFEALNRDFRYQLTAIGAPGPNLHIADEISDNRFRIAGGSPGLKVSWQATGIRRDAWANAHRIPVEEDKPSEERGHYLTPELYGAPAEKGIQSRPARITPTSSPVAPR